MTKPPVTYVLWVLRRKHRAPSVWVKTAEATTFDNWGSGEDLLRNAARCFVPKWCVLPRGKVPRGPK